MPSPVVASLLTAIAALGTLAQSGAAMTPPQSDKKAQAPVFGAGADLVLIDLIATGRDGRLVTDLRAEEIQVVEQSKPQRLEFLRLVEPREPVPRPLNLESGSTPVPDAMGDARTPGTPKAAPASLIVVVDVYTTPIESLHQALQAIVSMSREQIEPGTRLMLVALDRGIQIRQPFTEDAGTFTAAVESLRPSPGNSEASIAGFVEEVSRSCDGTANGSGAALVQAKVYLEHAGRATTLALEGLAALSRHLAAVPGRKHLVFFSAGYAMRPSAMAAEIVDSACGSGPTGGSGRMSATYTSLGGNDADSTRLLRAVLDEANRAQVSFYTVDARGLGGPGSDGIPSAAVGITTRFVNEGFLQRVQRASQNDPQEILLALAEETGGVASMNSNDLGRAMKAATVDARGYYMLAYAPPADRKPGRFYEIELKTSRPGLALRYRKGYEWLSDADRTERAVAHAILFPELHPADGLAVATRLEAGSLKILTTLPTRSLTFHEEGGEFRNDIELQGVLRDAKGKTVGKRYFFSNKVEMKLTNDRHQELLTTGNVEILSTTEAPKKGRYHLTVVARHSGGRLASAGADMEIP